ncbi:MAG: tetraacyldisaccharide 4'-kinase [Planctomycetota bacterium]
MKHRPDERLATRGGWVELLHGPAALFGGAARLRGWLYDRRVLPSYDVDVPVVGVGNLSAGGTGKTPMIAWLARELQGRGLRPGIVSRGYGAADGAPNDEATMLAEVLPDVPHVQNPDRVAAALELAGTGIDVVLLDDGFQHRRLARDVDLVLVDAQRPFGLPAQSSDGTPLRAFLPRGLMREPLSALRRAAAVVVTRSDSVDAERLDWLERTLERAAPGIPILLARHAPTSLRRIEGDGTVESLDLADLAGLEVDLFSGIGNPEAFRSTVESLGAEVGEHRVFPDHHAFVPGDLDGLGAVRPALTTAKDAARLASTDSDARPERLLVLDVELDVVRGRPILDAILDSLPASRAARERASIHEGLHG